MIVGFSGPRGGILYAQSLTLRRLLPRLNMRAMIHRDSGATDPIAHNMARTLGIPCVVVPLEDEHSTIASMPMGFKGEIIYKRMPRARANRVISKLVSGLIFVPHSDREDDQWDLYRAADRQLVPILFIWPDGRPEIR